MFEDPGVSGDTRSVEVLTRIPPLPVDPGRLVFYLAGLPVPLPILSRFVERRMGMRMMPAPGSEMARPLQRMMGRDTTRQRQSMDTEGAGAPLASHA